MAKKTDKLHAIPDGAIHWDKFMEKELASFKNEPGRHNCAILNQALDFAANYALLMTRSASYDLWEEFLSARLQLLKWYQLDALDGIFLPLREKLEKNDVHEGLLRVVNMVHHDRSIDELLPYIHLFGIKNGVVKQAVRWPIHVLKKLLALNPGRRQPAAALIVELLTAHPDWLEALQAACDEVQQKTLARLLAVESVAEAAMEELPDIIRNPPWKNRRNIPTLPQLELVPLHDLAIIHWTEETRKNIVITGDYTESIHQRLIDYLRCNQLRGNQELLASADWSVAYQALYILGANPESFEKILSCNEISSEDFCCPRTYAYTSAYAYACTEEILVLPSEVAKRVLKHAQTCSNKLFAFKY
ncbi:MAG: hypothetical protein WAO71_00780 [Gallionella sp.]